MDIYVWLVKCASDQANIECQEVALNVVDQLKNITSSDKRCRSVNR